jgi:hypothetical protein
MPESLDIHNVLEIERIRELLIGHPDLLSMFELLCIACNKRLNQDEQPVLSMELEPNPLLNLSDHSSDED